MMAETKPASPLSCPRCGAAMRERERDLGGGMVVVMDVCPSCGGVWLDKGELEQLTETESRFNSSSNRGRDDDDGDERGGRGSREGRRGGFLGNLFGD
jgi:Zn-finger nucleic acid-binding protein